jgi:L-aminopeptidase/D-esterase-like protein
MAELAPGGLTDIRGLTVGHAHDAQALTGCTVVLCPQGVTAGGEVRGLAPGTRETDLLRPGTLVSQVHAVLLAGGSAYGLAAADGVMRFLEEQGAGYDAGVARVPIVPAAVLFDLALGNATVRPDAAMGYRACQNASRDPSPQGNVGAGMGASVGKLVGMGRACKSGLGTASLRVGRLVVAALFAVNAFGDVLSPEDGHILAGMRGAHGDTFANTSALLATPVVRTMLRLRNTVIGVVASNAQLDVAETNQVAAAGHDGLARVVRPAHTLFDGDTIFALSTGTVREHVAVVCDLAARVTALAIANAVLAAEPAGGLPSARSLTP